MSVDPPQDAGNWDPGDDETGSISDITVKPTDQIICSAGVLSILETGAMDPGGVTLFYDMRLVLS